MRQMIFGVLLCGAAMANEVAAAPRIEPEGLPPLGKQWLESNPYRGNAVTHMPPWYGVLLQELAWAIQVFIASRSAAGSAAVAGVKP